MASWLGLGLGVRVRGTGDVSASVRVRVRVRLWLGFDLGHVQVEGGVEELVGVALEVHEEGVQVDLVRVSPRVGVRVRARARTRARVRARVRVRVRLRVRVRVRVPRSTQCSHSYLRSSWRSSITLSQRAVRPCCRFCANCRCCRPPEPAARRARA